MLKAKPFMQKLRYHVGPRAKQQPSYSLLVIPFASFCLGTWQIYRWRWKLNLIAELEKKTSEPPVPLPLDLGKVKELEYRKVSVKGHFDHSQEMFISPRSLLTKEDRGGSLISVGRPAPGCWVVTPFTLSDTGEKILVNRGWVPKNKKNPRTRVDGQIYDEIELRGVVRSQEKRQVFATKNQYESNEWHYRDVEKFAEKLSTLPIFVDADADSTIPGGPVGGQTRVNLRNEHVSYIITWYGLAITTSYIWYTKFISKKPLRRF